MCPSRVIMITVASFGMRSSCVNLSTAPAYTLVLRSSANLAFKSANSCRITPKIFFFFNELLFLFQLFFHLQPLQVSQLRQLHFQDSLGLTLGEFELGYQINFGIVLVA